MNTDYTGEGSDQLSDVVDKIKNGVDDKFIIFSSWNPSDLKLMAPSTYDTFAKVELMLVLVNSYSILQCVTLCNNLLIAVLCRQWGAILSNVSALC